MPWGAGLLADEAPEPGSTVTSGLLVVAGEASLSESASRLAAALAWALPEGFELQGGLDAEAYRTSSKASGGSGEAAPVGLAWDSLRLVTGGVDLAIGPVALEVAIGLELEPGLVAITYAGVTVCSVEVGFAGGTFVGYVDLVPGEDSRLVAPALASATLLAPDLVVSLLDCPTELAFAEAPATYQVPLLDQLASEVLAVLGPELESLVPAALGLDLATTGTLATEGGGAARLSVLAGDGAGASTWQVVDDRLVVPFATAVEALSDACVPALALPDAPARKVPSLDGLGDRALLLNSAVAERAAAAGWVAGALCGDRLTREVELDRDALTAAWPRLAALPPDTALEARVWPDAVPALAFEDGQDGATARLAPGLLTVELLARRGDTLARLATMKVDLEITGDLVLGSDGGVWLDPRDVRVLGAGTAAGLIESPAEDVAAGLAVPLAEALVAHHAIWQLPPADGKAFDVVHVLDGYLVLSRAAEASTGDRHGN